MLFLLSCSLLTTRHLDGLYASTYRSRLLIRVGRHASIYKNDFTPIHEGSLLTSSFKRSLQASTCVWSLLTSTYENENCLFATLVISVSKESSSEINLHYVLLLFTTVTYCC